jgi:putative transposase
MARLPRLSLPGLPHLVVQRGHNRQPVFVDEADRQAYLAALRDAGPPGACALHGYALLDDVAWLLLTPAATPAAPSLGALMQALGRRYVAAFNRRHGRSGTLWDGRFRATVVGPAQVLQALCLVEQAPVRAGLAGLAGDWRWSSAAHHLGLRRDPLLSPHAAYWSLGNTPFEREGVWRQRLADDLGAAEAQRLEEATRKGWPLGDGAFLASLAGRVSRPLERRPRGRPRKAPPSI